MDAVLELGEVTIGIGDGGNECGMGKVYDLVVEHVPLGEHIACEVSSGVGLELLIRFLSFW